MAPQVLEVMGAMRAFEIFEVSKRPNLPRSEFPVSARISVVRYFQYLGFLSYYATNFARKRVKTRYLTLFRATNHCVVICRASLLCEMGYIIHTYFVVQYLYLWNFRTFFACSFRKKNSHRCPSKKCG